ncbi:hypothetical protein K443DRAFT_15554 [Laccaria amethystina LaAM-08-1]|uniref:Uncharacterized protein n=1 Tax=Laccaria amethystina LaAM-08-1 TaxID=1095629 RepID=A0A0C9WL82_9AGAR|nr:hypothetical protein K443DRAFT_15554 [Laccaria amethystina LaAM-08-1]
MPDKSLFTEKVSDDSVRRRFPPFPVVHCNYRTNYGCGGEAEDHDKGEPGRTLS